MSDLPPVSYLNNREPWPSPSYIAGTPHNLPQRPVATTADYPTAAGGSLDVREIFRYASVVTVSLNVGTTSIKFLDAPIGKRNFLGFRNASPGTQILYIEFNAQATTGSWLAIDQNQTLLFDTVVPQDDLYVISSAAGGVLAYAYSTFNG